MKKKVLLHKIKTAAELEIPDIFEKMDISSVEIENRYEEIRTPLNLRRMLSYTFASLFIIFTVMIAYNFVYIPAVNDYEPLESETEIIGFQTVSAASLLSTIEVAELRYTESDFYVTELANQSILDPSIAIESEINLINNYMNMVETTISDEDYMLYETIESDREAYAYAFKYNSVDLANNLISYYGYYNLEENNGINFQTGIIVHEGRTYQFHSSLKETEQGSIYKYTISTNDNNYIEVANVSNDDAQKFSYSVYKGGILQEESVLTLKSFKNQLTAKIDIEMRTQSTLSLAFSRSYDNTTQAFSVSYQYNKLNQEVTGEFSVQLIENATTGKVQYSYQFDNNQNIITNRQSKGNQAASDDDFTPTNNNNTNNSTSNPGNSDQSNNPGNGNGRQNYKDEDIDESNNL